MGGTVKNGLTEQQQTWLNDFGKEHRENERENQNVMYGKALVNMVRDSTYKDKPKMDGFFVSGKGEGADYHTDDLPQIMHYYKFKAQMLKNPANKNNQLLQDKFTDIEQNFKDLADARHNHAFANTILKNQGMISDKLGLNTQGRESLGKSGAAWLNQSSETRLDLQETLMGKCNLLYTANNFPLMPRYGPTPPYMKGVEQPKNGVMDKLETMEPMERTPDAKIAEVDPEEVQSDMKNPEPSKFGKFVNAVMQFGEKALGWLSAAAGKVREAFSFDNLQGMFSGGKKASEQEIKIEHISHDKAHEKSERGDGGIMRK